MFSQATLNSLMTINDKMIDKLPRKRNSEAGSRFKTCFACNIIFCSLSCTKSDENHIYDVPTICDSRYFIYDYYYVPKHTYYKYWKQEKTTLSSRQACFVISHSSGDFNDKNIHNHRLYIYIYISNIRRRSTDETLTERVENTTRRTVEYF